MQAFGRRLLVLDSHIDLPYRLAGRMEDITSRTGGDFDYPRAAQGGLNAAFMAIYVPSDWPSSQTMDRADQLIEMVEGFTRRWPEKFASAGSVAEIRSNFREGLISLPLGMENGDPLQGDLRNLLRYHKKGVRYITLTHWASNGLGDSSQDPNRPWGGLSPFGKRAVREMNRLGMMIDVSHSSDRAFFQVAELSRAPIIASHSSCRHFTPDWERNMSDEMLLHLKEVRGVIQINFGSAFLSDQYRRARDLRTSRLQDYMKRRGLQTPDSGALSYITLYDSKHPLRRAQVEDVANHIEYVIQLIGVDHVGLGSDFDGVGDSLPTGLEDVSKYPNLIRELCSRGHSEEDIEKIFGENFLRVWNEVEEASGRGLD